MVLDSGLLNVLTVYAPHSGKPEKEKRELLERIVPLVSCIPQNEMVVLADGMLEVTMLAMMGRLDAWWLWVWS